MSFDAGLRKKIEFFHDALQEKVESENVGEMVEKLKCREKGWKYFFSMLRLFSTNKVKVTFPEKSGNVGEKV